MASPEGLLLLENSIRRSVLADSFEETRRLLDQYVSELEQTLRAAPAELSVLQSRSEGLFAWVAQLVLAGREEDIATAAHLRTLAGYREMPGPQSQVCTDA
jgi:hypothetical protein